MATIFSIPVYPGAVSYNLETSDPTVDNPQAQNPFGPWNAMTGSPIAAGSESNIIDPSGNQQLRLYRVQPIIEVNATQFTLQWYDPFSIAQTDLGGWFGYNRKLYDPLLSYMLVAFRDFIGDEGVDQTSATSDDMDTGAGTGLLQFDGTKTLFYLSDIPDATNATILNGSVHVIKNGIELQRNIDYVINYEAGYIVFAVAPTAEDECYIQYRESKYSNRALLAALDNAVGTLSHFGIGGYFVQDDNNVRVCSSTLPNDGLWGILFSIGLVIINKATIRIKSENARAYKQNDFTMDTAPGRIVDAMSKVAADDLTELRFKANNYIRSATAPLTHALADSFFDFTIPPFPYLNYYGYGYWCC